MRRAHHTRFAPLRLLLAALVLLAGLAGARMQGRMGAEAALASSLGGGMLCSGQLQPASGEQAPVDAHDHCLACNLPAVAAAEPAIIVRPLAYVLAAKAETSLRAAPAPHAPAYRSRAPPSPV